MKIFSKSIVAGALLGALAVVPAAAETAGSKPRVAKITANVSYQIDMPIADKSAAEMDRVSQTGRKMFYQRASTECAILLEILASSCRLKSLNVRSRPGNSRYQASTMIVSGSARFELEPK